VLLLLTVFLLIALSGCNALIETSRLNITPHQVEPAPPQDDGDFITVNTQHELERAMRDMVQTHVEQGLFRIAQIDDYGVESVVADAVREVSTDPLVAYMGSVFSHRILFDGQGQAYAELELTISYQRTVEQVVDVRIVHSVLGATTLLERILRDGETYLAMLSPTSVASVALLEQSIRDIYFSQALDVITLPRVQISLYPSSGTGAQRIAVVELYFGFDPDDDLPRMERDLRQAAETLIDDLPDDLPLPQELIWLAETLAAQIPPDFDLPEVPPVNLIRPRSISATAYGALVDGYASSEGFAMAFKAILELLQIESHVVLGERAGQRHAWNLVSIDGIYYHMDISLLPQYGPENTLFLSDEVMMVELDYTWDLSLYPRGTGTLRYVDFTD